MKKNPDSKSLKLEGFRFPSISPNKEPIANSEIPSNSPTNFTSLAPSKFLTTTTPSLSGNSSIFPSQIQPKTISNDNNKTIGIVAASIIGGLFCLAAIRFGLIRFKKTIGDFLEKFTSFSHEENFSDEGSEEEIYFEENFSDEGSEEEIYFNKTASVENESNSKTQENSWTQRVFSNSSRRLSAESLRKVSKENDFDSLHL